MIPRLSRGSFAGSWKMLFHEAATWPGEIVCMTMAVKHVTPNGCRRLGFQNLPRQSFLLSQVSITRKGNCMKGFSNAKLEILIVNSSSSEQASDKGPAMDYSMVSKHAVQDVSSKKPDATSNQSNCAGSVEVSYNYLTSIILYTDLRPKVESSSEQSAIHTGPEKVAGTILSRKPHRQDDDDDDDHTVRLPLLDVRASLTNDSSS